MRSRGFCAVWIGSDSASIGTLSPKLQGPSGCPMMPGSCQAVRYLCDPDGCGACLSAPERPYMVLFYIVSREQDVSWHLKGYEGIMSLGGSCKPRKARARFCSRQKREGNLLDRVGWVGAVSVCGSVDVFNVSVSPILL